ncbi:MAG: elongation factor 1-beta [Candidatus Woesearchaeota archaeon]|nr:MAG: elongation factor 1-beta [Candidatus Woesearchaeota archaeon]
MADVMITLKVMPESPDVDLAALQVKTKEAITNFCKEEQIRFEKKPLAFGLNELHATWVMDENIGTTDPLEEVIAAFDDVSSVEVIDVRRTLG